MSKYLKILIVLSGSLILISGSLVMAQDRPGMGSMAQKRFEEMDANQDGKISLEEQLASCQKRCKDRFNRIDTNDDGFIDKEEDKAAMSSFMEKGRQRMKDKGSQFMPKGN
jgi:Ca2+-binding EF-hand superfamily protein